MSNEITYQFQIQLSNGSLADSYASNALYSDQTKAAMVRNVLVVSGAVSVALDLGGILPAGIPGWGVFVNNDNTGSSAYLQLGTNDGTFHPFLRLYAGQQQLVHLDNIAVNALASSGSIPLFYIIYAE